MSENDGWASPGWRPPGPPPPSTPPPSTPPPGYRQPTAPPPGYQPAGVPAPGQPAGPMPPQPPASYPPQPPGAAGWYPEQPYYAPGWQAPVGPPQPSRRSRTGLVLGVIGGLTAVAVAAGAVVAVRFYLETRPLGPVEQAMSVHAGRVAPGHCLADLPEDGTVASAALVPCAEPHVAEVVGALPLGGGEWPGRDQVTDDLVAWCQMDTAQQAFGLRPVVWAPTEGGWGQGDTDGLCLAWAPSGTLTGSFVAGDQVTATG